MPDDRRNAGEVASLNALVDQSVDRIRLQLAQGDSSPEGLIRTPREVREHRDGHRSRRATSPRPRTRGR